VTLNGTVANGLTGTVSPMVPALSLTCTGLVSTSGNNGFYVTVWTGTQWYNFYAYCHKVSGTHNCDATSEGFASPANATLSQLSPCTVCNYYSTDSGSTLIGNLTNSADTTDPLGCMVQPGGAGGLPQHSCIVTVNGVAGPAPACTLTSVYGYDNAALAKGDIMGASDHLYTFNTLGSVGSIFIYVNQNPTFTTGNTPPNYYAPYSVSAIGGANNPGSFTYAFVGAGNAQDNQTTVEVNYTGSTTVIATPPTVIGAWCYDPSNGWTNWGNLLSVALAPGAPVGGDPGAPTTPLGNPNTVPGAAGFSWADCTLGDGIGWAPTSWVPGLVTLVKCAAQWLFIPTGPSVSSLTNIFGITSNAPTGAVGVAAYLGAMAKGAASFPASEVATIQSVASGGGCSLPGTMGNAFTISGQSVSACTVLTGYTHAPANALSAIGIVALILNVVVYIFAAFMLWHFFRKIIS
jgi:hypothetical protein